MAFPSRGAVDAEVEVGGIAQNEGLHNHKDDSHKVGCGVVTGEVVGGGVVETVGVRSKRSPRKSSATNAKQSAQLTKSEMQNTKGADCFPPCVAKMRISYPP